jgi:hypothetical protein
MILKSLLLLLIAYWILRAALNMWEAIKRDDNLRNPPQQRRDWAPRQTASGRSYDTVLSADARQAVERRRRQDKVEDARFTDL